MRTLDQKVLVLNKMWTAVGVATLQRAIVMLFSQYRDGEPKAKIIDPSQDFATFTWEDWSRIKPKDGDNTIHTGREQFRIPEVVLLTRYDKFPEQRVHFSRRTIYKRDNYKCQYCGCKPGTNELTIDHILPRSCGGTTTWENCVLACIGCNSQKADRVPEGYESSGVRLALKDRKDWIGPSPMILRSKPKKPRFQLFKGDRRSIPASWDNFISEAYWSTEWENDEVDE